MRNPEQIDILVVDRTDQGRAYSLATMIQQIAEKPPYETNIKTDSCGLGITDSFNLTSSPSLVQALKELGYTPPPHTPTGVTPDLLLKSDFIICLEPGYADELLEQIKRVELFVDVENKMTHAQQYTGLPAKLFLPHSSRVRESVAPLPGILRKLLLIAPKPSYGMVNDMYRDVTRVARFQATKDLEFAARKILEKWIQE